MILFVSKGFATNFYKNGKIEMFHYYIYSTRQSLNEWICERGREPNLARLLMKEMDRESLSSFVNHIVLCLTEKTDFAKEQPNYKSSWCRPFFSLPISDTLTNNSNIWNHRVKALYACWNPRLIILTCDRWKKALALEASAYQYFCLFI